MENVFKALPHVNEIWVTSDGKFHLHPGNGGKKVTRDQKQPEEKQAEIRTPKTKK